MKWRKALFISFAAVVLLPALIFTFSHPKNPHYSFSCNNSVDFSPFTATFNYDISDIDDSVFVNFGYWKEFYLPPENNLINMFYGVPGVYNVRLYTRRKTLDNVKVVAYSDDWEGGYFPNREDSLYQPFLNQVFYRQDDCFYADPNTLLADEGVVLKDRYYTSYRLFSPFNKSLDSLTLETSVLNNASTGSMMCYDTGLKLVGDSGIIDFNFTQSKCSRFAGLRVSDKVLSGEDTNLSALSVDMSNWLNIKVVNKNKEFFLYLDGQMIYQQKYRKPLGKLIGIIYYFFGTGKIDDLKVFDGEHQLFYHYDFGKETLSS